MVMRIKLIANDEHGSKCFKGWWEAKCNEQSGGTHGNLCKREPPLKSSHLPVPSHRMKFGGDVYLREYLPEKIQSYKTTQQGGRRGSKNPQ